MAASQRSTNGSAARTNAAPSSGSMPVAANESAATAHGDRAPVADGLADALDRLQPEPRAVLDRAAVRVGAPVRARREELRRQVGVRAVDVDDVEARLDRAARRRHPGVLLAADVGRRHRLRHVPRQVLVRDLARRRASAAGSRASSPSRRRATARRRPARRARARPRSSAAATPRRRRPTGATETYGSSSEVGRDRAVLGAHRAPAALGLHAAVRAPA